MTSRLSGLKPGDTRVSAEKLRSSRPAPTSSTSARAISATTSIDRMRRWRALPEPPRLSSLSDSRMSNRVACSAGTTPKTRPVTHRERQREQRHGPVDGDALRARQPRGHGRRQQRHAPRRQQQAGRAAGAREHEALDEQLPDDARAAGADRDAHGHFFLPADRAREQQVGDVRARNQQHQRRRRRAASAAPAGRSAPADPARG